MGVKVLHIKRSRKTLDKKSPRDENSKQWSLRTKVTGKTHMFFYSTRKLSQTIFYLRPSIYTQVQEVFIKRLNTFEEEHRKLIKGSFSLLRLNISVSLTQIQEVFTKSLNIFVEEHRKLIKGPLSFPRRNISIQTSTVYNRRSPSSETLLQIALLQIISHGNGFSSYVDRPSLSFVIIIIPNLQMEKVQNTTLY